MTEDELICICMEVSRNQITALLIEQNYRSTRDIQHATWAGTCCGKCLPLIDQVLRDSFIDE